MVVVVVVVLFSNSAQRERASRGNNVSWPKTLSPVVKHDGRVRDVSRDLQIHLLFILTVVSHTTKSLLDVHQSYHAEQQ